MGKRTPIGDIEHVAVAMPDIAAARKLFHDTLRLPIAEYPGESAEKAFALRAGQTVIRVIDREADEVRHGQKGVSHVAVRVPSINAIAEQLDDAGVKVREQTNPINGRKELWSDRAKSIGIALRFVEESTELSFSDPENEQFIERVDHLGIACHSGKQVSEVYVDGLGWPLECTQTDSEFLIPLEVTSNDKYGVTSRAGTPIPTIGSGLIALFVWTGDFDFEFMQPLGPAKLRVPLGSAPGTVGQDQGAIARALESRGEGLLHICFKTPSIRDAIRNVKAAGIKMIDDEPRPGGRGSEIAFMDRKTTEGVLLHFAERTPE